MSKPLVLCIMDGVGISRTRRHNAVALADMPFFDSLLAKYPHSKLKASGTAVGLPIGIMGNSEVGHITIGAGRVVNQFLRRFELEDFDNNKNLNHFISVVKKKDGIVLSQSVLAGTKVEKGSTITLTINKIENKTNTTKENTTRNKTTVIVNETTSESKTTSTIGITNN